MPPSGNLLILCIRTVVPEVTRWQNFAKMNLELHWPLWGAFQLDRITHLTHLLESKRCEVEQTEWDAYFNWYTEAYKRLQDAKIASLKDMLQKANEKLKTQEGPKTEDYGTDVTLPPLPSFFT